MSWIRSLIAPRLLAVALATVLAALTASGGPGGCSGGGGGSSSTVASLPWGRFRGDVSGSGIASGDVSVNSGVIRFSVSLPGGATRSSPVIGMDDTIYLGTGAGLLAVSPDGAESRLFEGYTTSDCAPCVPPAEGCQPVGPVSSSPALTANGDIVVHTENGRILALHDDGSELTCRWVSQGTGETDRAGTGSSPIVVTDPVDGSLSAVFLGTATGHLLALNGDGSEKWRVAPSGAPGTPITASPVISSGGTLYITTPDGFLHAFTLGGRRKWRLAVAQASEATEMFPSPAAGVAVYTVSPNGAVAAVNPDGTLSWRLILDAPVAGSAGFMSQYVELKPTVIPTPESTPGETPEATPTPTATPETSLDTVVYVVDEQGTLYGIRDSSGHLEGKVVTGATGINTSPAIAPQTGSSTTTTPPFLVFGGADGFIYATTLDGGQPCADCEDVRWESLGGAGARLSVGAPVMCSPVIGDDGTIYVTIAEGRLLAIGEPPTTTALTRTPSPTPTATPTPT